jgi:hypothetical protein
MSRPRPKERYESCVHRFACDRMAAQANLIVWYMSGDDASVSVAYAYGCDVCREWKKEETA